jgi:hypothetical protein
MTGHGKFEEDDNVKEVYSNAEIFGGWVKA